MTRARVDVRGQCMVVGSLLQCTFWGMKVLMEGQVPVPAEPLHQPIFHISYRKHALLSWLLLSLYL